MEWTGFYHKQYMKIDMQFVFINQPYDVKQQSNGENLSNTQSLVRNIFITMNMIYKLVEKLIQLMDSQVHIYVKIHWHFNDAKTVLLHTFTHWC